jgi:hypothetical protein
MRTVRLLCIPLVLCATHAAHADAKACKAGALVFGNPTYAHKASDQPNPSGQTVRQDPPLAWEGLAFAADKVYTTSLKEIWGGPVSGAIKRIAGIDEAGGKPADGPCADARFGTIWGLALLRDGTIIVADHEANSIVAIADADKPSCKVTTLVGAKHAAGDKDGPAADAAIGNPSWPVTDGSGNIYFIDGGTSKVKMVAPDAAHTVSTLGQLKTGGGIEPFHGMTMLDDKLYAVTSTFSNGVVQEVDPATKKVRTVKDAGGASFPPNDASHSPALSSITNDGSALLIFGRGYVWRMTPDGRMTHVAGSGWDLDFPKGYNAAGVYPPKDLKLYYKFSTGNAGAPTYLAWQNNALYWRGWSRAAYVVKIDCP